MTSAPATAVELVAPFFPDADEEEANFLLWNKTAYPFMGKDWRYYRNQLCGLRLTIDAGETPCEMCNRPAEIELTKYTHCFICCSCFSSGLYDLYREEYL